MFRHRYQWVTKDERTLFISEMTDTHLLNVKKGLDEKYLGIFEEHYGIDIIAIEFEIEMRRRLKKFKKELLEEIKELIRTDDIFNNSFQNGNSSEEEK